MQIVVAKFSIKGVYHGKYAFILGQAYTSIDMIHVTLLLCIYLFYFFTAENSKSIELFLELIPVTVNCSFQR